MRKNLPFHKTGTRKHTLVFTALQTSELSNFPRMLHAIVDPRISPYEEEPFELMQ